MITGHGTKLLYIYQQATFSEAASSKQACGAQPRERYARASLNIARFSILI